MQTVERCWESEKGSFSALRRKGRRRSLAGREKGRQAHAFTKQPVGRTSTMSWLHESICPYLSKIKWWFVRRRFASWELALKVPGRLLCACNTPKQMQQQQQMEAGAGGFSRKKMNRSISSEYINNAIHHHYSQRWTWHVQNIPKIICWFIFSEIEIEIRRQKRGSTHSPGTIQAPCRARPEEPSACGVRPMWCRCRVGNRSCISCTIVNLFHMISHHQIHHDADVKR